jgi:transposase
MMAVTAHEGSMRRVDVEFFLEDVLVSDVIVHYRGHPLIHPPFQMPVMGRFPGPNSILVLDNAPVHHGGRIAEICDNADVLLVYLPPYSPDMNPIEKVFSVLKNRLKRAQILTGTDADAQIVMDFLPAIVTPALMRSLYLGSGYAA